jgi:F-type H+-transporting ATPase subunit gamma
MATLKDIKRKIGAVKKTQQITRAMHMVAASKLRGAQQAVEQFRPYADKFSEVLASLLTGMEEEIHPFFQVREDVEKVAVFLLTSDRGLCGSFNVNLINAAETLIKELRAKEVEPLLITGGRKGRDFYRKRQGNLVKEYINILDKPDYDLARQVSGHLTDLFLTEEVDEVYVIYSRFVNLASFVPTTRRLLPVSLEDLIGEKAEEASEETSPGYEYLVEPSAGEVMIELLPKNLSVQVLSALLETACSEYAARMMAMDNATSNCKDLIENLTLAYNKARQAAITAELMDIVGGTEALTQ